MTLTIRIDHAHLNPVAALRSGDLEMPKLMALLKPQDVLKIVNRRLERASVDLTAKTLGITE